MNSTQKIKFSLMTLFVLLGGGTFGYVIIEGWTPFEAFYMTTITLATVGFSEVHDLSLAGRIFTVLLIIFGVGSLAYVVGSVVQFMVEGQLHQLLGRKKLQKQIDHLKEHYIICGYGRIGSSICRDLADKPLPFVVVENNPDRVARLAESDYLYIVGDATEDEVLIQAGIRQAKGLISVVSQDTQNLFIVLTARGLNPGLFILARASEESSELKLRRAGANKVISPYAIGAHRMAQAILRPSVLDLIDIATGCDNLELQIEEIKVAEHSELVGKKLIDSGIRSALGVIIVAIKKDQRLIYNPAAETMIDAGCVLIALGEQEEIKKLEKIATAGN